MATQTERRLMTAEELLAMPDDGYRYELVRGELRKMAAASNEHGEFAGYIASSLGPHVIQNRLGKIYIADSGFILERDPDHVRVPDLSFVRRERTDTLGRPPGYWPEAPTLAVEVISPNDRYTAVNEKVADYLTTGTSMVVVVNPRNRTVNVHTQDNTTTLRMGDTLDGADVVPGWQMPVSDIFVDW